MGTEYDSVKIRALAQRVYRAGNAVGKVRTGALKSVSGEIQTSFRGDAANALSDSVNTLMADVNSVSSGLIGLSNELFRLAERVERADQAAAELIRTK